MTERTTEESNEDDLHGVEAALFRAAQRARERAIATGTCLVVSRNGVLELIPPERLAEKSQEVAERAGQYGDQE